MCKDKELVLELMDTLTGLLPTQFDQLLLIISPPKGIIPDRTASHADRVNRLLEWAVSYTGTGGDALLRIQQQLLLLNLINQSSQNSSENEIMSGTSDRIIYRAFDNTDNPDTHLDVIFIHGLYGIGQGVNAWKNQSSTVNWLEQLQRETNSTIWIVDYQLNDIDLSSSNPLSDFSNSLIRTMRIDRLGDNPIVFIAHDLGGLILKQLMLNLINSPSDWKKIKYNTVRRIFISVPHSGENIDTWFDRCFSQKIRESGIEFTPDNQIQTRNSFLRINNKWRDYDLGTDILYISTNLRGGSHLVGDEVHHPKISLRFNIAHNLIHQLTNNSSILYLHIQRFLIDIPTNIIVRDKVILFRIMRGNTARTIELPRDQIPTQLNARELISFWDRKLELWKQIHYHVDDLKTELKNYHKTYDLYGSSVTHIESDKLIRIRDDIRPRIEESVFRNKEIEKVRETHEFLIINDNEYNENETLYAYAKFLLDINDILPTTYECFPIDDQIGLNNDIHKIVANTIETWLNKSLRQADQMIQKYIDSIISRERIQS